MARGNHGVKLEIFICRPTDNVYKTQKNCSIVITLNR